MLMEMNLSENGGARQQVNNAGGGGRRRSKGSTELTHKKNKQPQRGMGVEQLERVLRLQERWKKMTEVPSLHPLPLPLPSFNSVPNVALQFRPHAQSPTPAMMYHGIGIHGANQFSADQHVVADPSVIGSSNVGLHFENSKELSSIPSYGKCVSDSCGVCHKKKRINSGSTNACWVNQFHNFSGNNTVVEMIDAGKTRRSSGQVAGLMTVHRNGGGTLPEYEFFPGKGGGGAEEYKELMKMGATTTTWCGSGTSVGGVIGLRGGEGSCVTAITGSEEGSVSSIDLTLKLSY